MEPHKKPAVLVCVTAQNSCDRLIKIGAEYAKIRNCDLHVLMVHPPVSDYISMSSEMEYLYQTTKYNNGEMTIIFDSDAPKIAADFARKLPAERLVTGMPDGRLNGFIVRFHEALPDIPISMVSKDSTVYNMEKESIMA